MFNPDISQSLNYSWTLNNTVRVPYLWTLRCNLELNYAVGIDKNEQMVIDISNQPKWKWLVFLGGGGLTLRVSCVKAMKVSFRDSYFHTAISLSNLDKKVSYNE